MDSFAFLSKALLEFYYVDDVVLDVIYSLAKVTCLLLEDVRLSTKSQEECDPLCPVGTLHDYQAEQLRSICVGFLSEQCSPESTRCRSAERYDDYEVVIKSFLDSFMNFSVDKLSK